MSNQRNQRRELVGLVKSDKMDKTIVVSVETYRRHGIYGKRVKYGKTYYAHDEENLAKVGDKVLITATRPLSATKRWRLVKVLAEAELTVKEAEALREEALLESVEEVEEIEKAAKARHAEEEKAKVEKAKAEKAAQAVVEEEVSDDSQGN
jgi:small subunit ribosomal protein S17